MSRFCAAIGVLAAPFALLVGLSGYWLSKAPANEYAAKRALFEQRKQTLEVLVLGSSHSFYGILPGCLGRPALNLAAPSQTLYYDHALLEKYLDQMPSLKLVILPVSYFSFERQLDQGIERWRSYYYRYEWGLPHRNRHMAFHIRNFFPYFLCEPELGRSNILLNRIKDVSSDFDESGGLNNCQDILMRDVARAVNGAEEWVESAGHPLLADALSDSEIADHLQQSARVQLAWHDSRMDESNVAENVRLLDGIIQQLKRRGIQLVLISTPMSHYYTSGMNPIAYQRMQTLVRQACASNQLQYRNYLFDKRFHDRDFMDSSHLNHSGARKFSFILRNEMVSPAWEDEGSM
jgi:hypothetical protein